jgi:hypothetical protein
MLQGRKLKIARSLYDGTFIVGKQRGSDWLVRGNDYTGEGDNVWKIGEEVEVLEKFITDSEIAE